MFEYIHVHQTPEFLNWLDRLLAREAAEMARQSSPPCEPERLILRGTALNVIIALRTFWGQNDRAWQAAVESKAIFEGMGEAGEGYLVETFCGLAIITMVFDPDQAWRYLEHSLELLKRHDLPYSLTFCLKILANLFGYLGDQEKAIEYFEEGLRVARKHSIWGEEAMLLSMLGWTEFLLGRSDRALELLAQSQAGYTSVNESDHVAGCIYDQALIVWSQENDPELLRLIAETNSMGEETDSIVFFLNAQELLARREWALGQYEQAARRAEAALVVCRPYYFGFAGSLNYILGRVALSQGQLDQAALHFRQYDEIADAPRWRWKAYALHGFGLLAAAQIELQPEQAERAALLFGAQHALFDWLPNLFAPIERLEYQHALASVRAALGEDAFAAAWARGQAMPRKEVFALMLQG